MAIDDNTQYSLSGAQVKELANKIKAVEGEATLFYFDGAIPWTVPTSVPLFKDRELTQTVGKADFMGAAKTGQIILVSMVVESGPPAEYYNWQYLSVAFCDDDSMNEGLGAMHFYAFLYDRLCEFSWDNTTDPVLTAVLSIPELVQTTGNYNSKVMSQKATTDALDGRVKTNAGAPTTSTVGTKGQILEDTTNGKLYICTDATNPYVWEEVGTGGGGLVTLSYGASTWQDFLDAYNAGEIVYCRASSGSNPGVGDQTRMAFMAYVNNPTTPTEVEFQYVRSISSKTAAQPCDQVFVYKLTSTGGGTWTVESRDVTYKVAAGTNVTTSYSNGTVTINADAPVITMTSTDPGEGGSLAANNFIAVYNAS